MNKGRLRARIITTAAGAVFALLAAVALGSTPVALSDTAAVIASGVLGLPCEIDAATVSVVWGLRLPRVLLAFMSGCSLAAGGAALQSALGNALASPYTLGVSSGASLGAGVAIICGMSAYMLPVAGILCGVLSIIIVTGIATALDKRLSSNTVILSGMVFSLFASAVLTTLSALFSEDLKQIVLWQMGSFALKGFGYAALLLPFMLLGIGVLLMRSRALDILALGDEVADSLGVAVSREKLLVFGAASLLCGATVAVSGVIGFVDLIAPHVARRLFGSKHLVCVPMAALLGGVLMVAADLLARVAVPSGELPVGAVTALIGTPFFLTVFIKGRRSGGLGSRD